jgi:ribosome-binding ATPase YchF (GTP1/OBG family)
VGIKTIEVKMEETISLREYFDSKIEDLENLMITKVLGLDKATTLAANNMERRLEGMNEFRQQLKDQSLTFLTRSEYEQFIRRVDEDIRMLRESKALLEGKASQNYVNFSVLVSIIGIILSAIALTRDFFIH